MSMYLQIALTTAFLIGFFAPMYRDYTNAADAATYLGVRLKRQHWFRPRRFVGYGMLGVAGLAVTPFTLGLGLFWSVMWLFEWSRK
jgi:hypothetical protein